jgi:hypothetical protein
VEISLEGAMAGPGPNAVWYRGVAVAAGTRAWATGPDLPGDVEFVLGIEETPNPRLVVTELTVRQRDGGPPVTTTGLREISIPKLIAAVVDAIWQLDAIFMGDPEDETFDKSPMWQHTRSRRGQGRALADDQLAEVAAVYKANPGHTTRAVKDRFKIGRSTAGDYITRARDAGLLED